MRPKPVPEQIKVETANENELIGTIKKRKDLIISFVVGLVYYFSDPKPQSYYDYTFRVAESLLHGSVGIAVQPPSWVNEFVPFDGVWYSVFPLGAVLSMIPAALLKTIGIVGDMPGSLIAALLAMAICLFLLKIASRHDLGWGKQILIVMGVLFGTFMWTNMAFAGAWQLALGFAMLGELGAIYFTIYDRRPFVAGLFFAIAFGNRTENLLTAPIFLYLLNRGTAETDKKDVSFKNKVSPHISTTFSPDPVRTAWFCAVPFVLGVATLGYNYVRFHSFTDFGYARIPGVLQEPWYDHGIFSTYYIPRQAWEMLGKMWEWHDKFPYLLPDRFSSSILLSSPWIILMLRTDAKDSAIKLASWTALAVLTFLLWIHGNSGGWQFGYRYAMVLLPWIFVIMLRSAPKRITRPEWALYGISFAANIYATWLFCWTDQMK